MQFLVELSQRQAFCRIEFSMERGQLGIVRFEQHFKPGELPIRDRRRVESDNIMRT